jgi:hypothetical protein
MRTDRPARLLALSCLAATLATTPALAGGPLYLTEDTRKPLRWNVTTPVRAYTDLGDLCDTTGTFGCLTNEQTDAAVVFAFAQWSGVASSSFRAQVAGDFGALGLGDITGANAGEIVGPWNGGGYHVMYDADGSIVQDFFGAPYGVLGISSPEWAEGETITESWAVFTAASVPTGDDGTKAAGVITHEFGHGINLSHTQANGHITFFGSPWYWIAWAPRGCAAPYDVSPIEDFEEYMAWINGTMIPATETMYPFISPEETGAAMSTVDRPDDIAALSNLYPAAGWPANRGAIRGQILLRDGRTPLTGVNVVARNVDDPLGDVVTVMSGDQTQGLLGPDGRFTINGLRPGARYVLYVEGIIAGGFPTPPAVLPSFQEYWNGAGESGDANADDPCAWSTVTAQAGTPAAASIAFNGIARAPTFVQIPVAAATDVDNGGQTVVGTYGGQVAWRYDVSKATFTVVDSASDPRLARDGRTMTVNRNPALPPWEGGMYEPGLWTPSQGFDLFALPAGEPGCDGMIFAPWDLSENGSTVVGLGYRNGCPRPLDDGSYSKFYGASWTARRGLQYLDTPDVVFPDMPGCSWDREFGCSVYGSRANAISGDGRVVVGHVDAGQWFGAAWLGDRFAMIGADDPKGYIGSANAVNRDGSAVTGGTAGDAGYGGWGIDAYLWSPARGTTNIGHISKRCEDYAPWECEFNPILHLPTEGFAVSDAGDLVVGRAGDFWNGFVGFLWVRGFGMVDLNEFLQAQGVMEAYSTSLIGPLAVAADGKTIVGWGGGETSSVSFLLRLDQVWVCNNNRSQLVGFPGAMISHVSRGATPGLCPADRPIEP